MDIQCGITFLNVGNWIFSKFNVSLLIANVGVFGIRNPFSKSSEWAMSWLSFQRFLKSRPGNFGSRLVEIDHKTTKNNHHIDQCVHVHVHIASVRWKRKKYWVDGIRTYVLWCWLLELHLSEINKDLEFQKQTLFLAIVICIGKTLEINEIESDKFVSKSFVVYR